MRISKATKIINATNETGDSDIPTYKQAQEILDCKDSDWEDFGFSCEEECQWFKRKAEKLLAKRAEVNACKIGGSTMRITKATKTDVTASIDSDIAKYKKSLERKAAKSGIYEDFGRDELRVLRDKYPTLPDDNTDPRTAERNRRSIDSFESWCDNFDLSSIKSSSDTDKALQHIKAAIDILGKSGNKDDITKDSIANLSVVMFDLKGKK